VKYGGGGYFAPGSFEQRGRLLVRPRSQEVAFGTTGIVRNLLTCAEFYYLTKENKYL
jgi:hypothetical protein